MRIIRLALFVDHSASFPVYGRRSKGKGAGRIHLRNRLIITTVKFIFRAACPFLVRFAFHHKLTGDRNQFFCSKWGPNRGSA